MGKMKCYQIQKNTLPVYENVILPVIYEELADWKEELLEGYFCIGVKDGRKPVGALIAEHEDELGDLTILSLYVLPDYRRQGIGSRLLQTLTDVAYALYEPLPGEYGADIFLKTVYSLPDDMRLVWESFLKKHDFTDYYVFEPRTEDHEEIRGASAEVHFFFQHSLKEE